MPLTAIAVLALGTYAIRAAGPVLAGRYTLSAGTRRLLAVGATILLAALAVTAAGLRALGVS